MKIVNEIVQYVDTMEDMSHYVARRWKIADTGKRLKLFNLHNQTES